MLTNRSFSQVLKEMEHEENSSGADFSAGWESHLDAFNLAQLLGDVQVSLPQSFKPVKKAYPYKAVPKPRLPHVMSPLQALAFAEIKRHSKALPEAFSLRELKSAFRQSVLKTHPDKGGDSETFQLVKKSYHILEALVKNEA